MRLHFTSTFDTILKMEDNCSWVHTWTGTIYLEPRTQQSDECYSWGRGPASAFIEWRLVQAHGGVKTVSRNPWPRTYQPLQTEMGQLSPEPHRERAEYLSHCGDGSSLSLDLPVLTILGRELSRGLQVASIPAVEAVC